MVLAQDGSCDPDQIRALPARITNRIGPLPPGLGSGWHVPRGGQLYLYRQWSRRRSRPPTTDVCSMFARTPRYTPAPLGIRIRTQIRSTGQNGSSRHALALFDSSPERISEQSSGLLIRGFGGQVPGGAPELAVFALGVSVAGLALGAEYIGDYLAAVTLGIVFQYFAITPMRGLGLRKGLIETARPPSRR